MGFKPDTKRYVATVSYYVIAKSYEGAKRIAEARCRKQDAMEDDGCSVVDIEKGWRE